MDLESTDSCRADFEMPADEFQLAAAVPGTASDQAIEGTVSDQGSDNDDASADGSCKASSAGGGLCVPIMFPTQRKLPKCFLCHRMANEPSPLNGAHRNDKYGGFVPWNSYRKVKNDSGKVVGKIPKGSICLPSRNVFTRCGYTTTYGTKDSFKVYKKVMASRDGGEVHQSFLNYEKSWLKTHNDDHDIGSKGRIRDKRSLEAVTTRLEVTKETGSRFKAPPKTFVEVAHWDANQDGPLDPDKVMEKEIFGVMRKGAWVNRGRAGAWDCEDYEGTVQNNTTVEEEGSGQLVGLAVAAKVTVLNAAAAAARTERDSKAVEAPKMDFAKILALANISLPGSSTDADATASAATLKPVADGEVVEDVSSVDDASDDDDNGDGGDGADMSDRLAAYFGGSKSAAKASTASSRAKSSTASGQAKSSTSQKVATTTPMKAKASSKAANKGSKGSGKKAAAQATIESLPPSLNSPAPPWQFE